MLSAHADVFVPREFPVSVPTAYEDVKDYSPGQHSFYADELCSTTAGDLSDDLSTRLSSPFWDTQESPHWETPDRMDTFGGMLPDLAAGLDYSKLPSGAVGELGGDPTFSTWTNEQLAALCCSGDDDFELAMAAEDSLDDIAAAAVLSMWAQGGLSRPECVGPDQDPFSYGAGPPQASFVSSCELARQLAPRPQDIWDVPVLIQIADETLDGCSTLAPILSVAEEFLEEEWSFLPGCGYDDDYSQKVILPEGILRDLEALDGACSEKDAELPRHCWRPRVATDPGVGIAVVGPPGLTRNHGGSVEMEALGTFDGFFFSEPPGLPVKELAVEQGRTYTAL